MMDGQPSAQLSGFRMAVAVDSIPSMMAMPHDAKDAAEAATSIAGSDVLTFLSKSQALKFSPMSVSDILLNADDGRGGKVMFDGFSNVPAVRLQTDYYSQSLQIQHSVSQLSVLNTSVYIAPNPLAYDSMQTVLTSTIPLDEFRTMDSLADRLRWVLEQMQKFRETGKLKTANTEPLNTAIADAIVAQNEDTPADGIAPIDLWYQILRNSTESLKLATIKPVAKVTINADAVNRMMFHVIATIYAEPGYGFFDRIRRFAATFQILFVPVPDANNPQYPGYLMGLSDLWNVDNETPLELDSNGISPQVGSLEFRPMQQVLIRGQAPQNHKFSALPQTEKQLLGVWPAANKLNNGGRVQNVAAPVWLPPVTNMTSTYLAREFLDGKTPTLESMKKLDQKAAVELTAGQDLLRTIMTEWARTEFVNLALGGDSITVDCPLNFTPQVGKRYFVILHPTAAMSQQSSMRDKFYFHGFLASAQHRYEIQGDTQGVAGTMLTFTHCLISSYEFPYL